MAAASCLPTEDHFLCPICLDVFTEPVTTLCRHTFWKCCITQHWENDIQCQCLICMTQTQTRPELQINVFISEMTAWFRLSAKNKKGCGSELECTKTQVSSDISDGTKVKTLKSGFLLWNTPGASSDGISPKKSSAAQPCGELGGQKHNKPLELFWKNDQMCVTVHNTHCCSSARRARGEGTWAEGDGGWNSKDDQVEGIKHQVQLSDQDANRETAAEGSDLPHCDTAST